MKEMEKSAVEWLYNHLFPKQLDGFSDEEWNKIDLAFKQAKEMEKEQRGYTESDMRSYASYILNNPVIEPSQWYKIYRTKSK